MHFHWRVFAYRPHWFDQKRNVYLSAEKRFQMYENNERFQSYQRIRNAKTH